MSRYSVTVTGDTASEIADNLAAFMNMLHASTAYSATPESELPKRKRGRPAKAKPEPETIEGTAEVVSEEAAKEPATESAADAGEPDNIGFATAEEPATEAVVENADALRAELKAELTKLHAAKGLNYVVRVLQQYNADRVSSVKPELLAKVIAEAKQYLAAQ